MPTQVRQIHPSRQSLFHNGNVSGNELAELEGVEGGLVAREAVDIVLGP